MILITVLFTLSLLAYSVMILWLYPKLEPKTVHGSVDISVSVLIPFRNERKHLLELMEGLRAQDYGGAWEVILINDHSDDGGDIWLKDYLEKHNVANIRLVNSPQSVEGKKVALALGAGIAQHEVIVQTDADCTMHSHWLSGLVSNFNDQANMVLGAVAMEPGSGFWSKFAALEFMSLQASGAGFALANKPFMGSAANMAYRKEAWEKYSKQNEALSSGDDVFMIQALAKETPESITHVLDEGCQVYTAAPATFSEFINQRARWGSKTSSYTSKTAIVVALLVALLAFAQLGCFILGVTNVYYLLLFLWMTLVKAVVDYAFLHKYAGITKQRDLLKIFVPSVVIYPFYICITLLAMLFKIEWKGREIKKR